MITAIDLTKLGKYAEAIRRFTERVSQLPEVKAVKANPCKDYVDLWVIVDKTGIDEVEKKSFVFRHLVVIPRTAP